MPTGTVSDSRGGCARRPDAGVAGGTAFCGGASLRQASGGLARPLERREVEGGEGHTGANGGGGAMQSRLATEQWSNAVGAVRSGSDGYGCAAYDDGGRSGAGVQTTGASAAEEEGGTQWEGGERKKGDGD